MRGIFSDGDVAGIFHKFLALGREHEVHDLPRVFRTRAGRDHVNRRDQRIGAAADVLDGRCDTVDGEQLDLVVAEHFRGVIAEGKTEGGVVVPVVCGVVDDVAHAAEAVLLQRRHDRRVAHQFLKGGLAAASLVALERDDLRAERRADLHPARDLPGINAPNLVRREVFDRVVRIHEEDEGVHAERRELVLNPGPFRFLGLQFRRRQREDQFAFAFQQFLVDDIRSVRV